MAQIQTVHLVDDLTGDRAAETIPFTLDGKQFEIDLSADNATALRETLAPFVAAAHRVSPSSDRHGARAARGNSGSGPSSTAERQHNQAVRTWARQNGYTVSERGRIPAKVVSAYQSAAEHPPSQRDAAVQSK